MNMGPFILNERFVIEPLFGSVQDKQTSKNVRIEPRLMNLLCMLSQHQGELVSRDAIRKEIWDDYAGADDGLTQAISYLRKLLADDNRSIIETVPKKGYVLRAVISTRPIEVVESQAAESSKKGVFWIVFILICLLLGAIILYRLFGREKQINDDLYRQGDKHPPATAGGKLGNPDVLSDTSKR